MPWLLLSCALAAAGPRALAASPAPAASASASVSAGNKAPVAIAADSVQGQPDGWVRAQGSVRLGQGPLRLDTPELRYDPQRGLVVVEGGGVRWSRAQDLVEGDGGEFDVQGSRGEFRSPRFFFGLSRAGGSGSALRLLDGQRVEIIDARLTSCLIDDAGRLLREPGTVAARLRAPKVVGGVSEDPAVALEDISRVAAIPAPPMVQTRPGWELLSSRIRLDFEREEGVAENARLRFLGVPVLALPQLGFPLGEARRSGWLPPTARVDTRGGFQLSVPYYLNLAPNQDATITPMLATRRGPGAEVEYRYLGSSHSGLVQAHALPNDQTTGSARGSAYWQYFGKVADWDVRAVGLRVSDDAYWKDFGFTQTFRTQTFGLADLTTLTPDERVQPTLQPRLPQQSVQTERSWQWGRWSGTSYGRVLLWQPLQGTNAEAAFVSPYQRAPQAGTAASAQLGAGIEVAVETEVNRFTRPSVGLDLAPQLRDGTRWHGLASFSRPWISSAGWFIPRLSVNSAAYRLEGGAAAGRGDGLWRTIPTLSADTGLLFERPSSWWDRPVTQTVEPRLVYVNTPMRDQRDLPNFDAAPKEFNTTSIFSENAFSGIDRVSDSHQLTMGMTGRMMDQQTGAEIFRGSVAQRLQFRDQTTTPAGTVANQRLSDILLATTVMLTRSWVVDATLQYSPDLQRTTRSVLAMRYSLGPGRTLVGAYRYARDLSETLEVRANWPIWNGVNAAAATAGSGSGGCQMLISGATRLNYNTRESRMADSLAGLEVDAGCWVLRMGVQRQSTGLTEEVTRLILQIELSGLSRSRANPLRF